MSQKRCLALFNDGWADWEAGHVLAGLREFLNWTVRVATPRGEPAESIGGTRAVADCTFADVKPEDFDLLLIIGSDQWNFREFPEVSELLRQTDAAQKFMGTICAANKAAAYAGILNRRSHTGNDRAGLERAAGYAGQALYRNVPHAVRDQRLVSAPGSAPQTFAAEIFRMVDSENGEKTAAMFLQEFGAER